MQHDFVADLSYSQDQGDHPMWEEVYRRAFPTLEATYCVRNDGWAQRGGIDRVLMLKSGKTLYVDEKIRRKAYQDVLLEYKHVYKNGNWTPGWIAKDLACDYIAYAWEPLSLAYLLPFHQLRRAWHDNRKEWVANCFKSEADNGSYTTIGCCVPISDLLPAINDAMRIDFGGA